MPENPAEILIVDDEPLIREILTRKLKSSGYRPIPAENAFEALNTMRDHPCPLVLSDIMMPGMEGREVCRWLRSNPTTEAVPVIFLSAIDSLAEKLKAFEAGGNDFVSKPFDDRQFVKKVKDLLRLSGARTSMERIRRR